ncbi:putative choloylglycine hydrolase [Breznakia sp. PF5-3]|uniref:C45 family autoproteolytic acyltransferase/hydolase n=1 Tax=unclassified Breznakia TaxID=2623764 RepID=UPI0024051C8C|nr:MULTISPECIES: C45 family peptidase [unclassified Breznakia]MDF9824176.1 putative choloylglycine hydrolase [Breznakia sp. PM6-1]MDF9834974.1 putative choloylglycine hydrolase [Breznakia sp. PF5-3]MDF9837157.1 putative choloylglycine hydrolase [Breznakia sp. PFB2-8]MDF9859147.1 putative choloylglycine hydrolase [Breznakia sp. PH5-24]
MYHPRFKGSYYEAGFKFGSMMKKNGVDVFKFAKQPEEQLKFGIQCIEVCKKWYPAILEEMQGIADGLEMSFEKLAAWLFCIYCYTQDNWCTCIACKDDDHIFFARNSDFMSVVKDLTISAYYRLDNAYSFIGNTTAFVQMEDGVNEHGLAVGLNFIVPKVIAPGLNAGILVRMILEKCKTTKEAIELLKQVPHSSSHSLLIADASGDMVVAECNAKEVVFRGYDDNFVVSTNDFKTPTMKKYKVSDVPDTIHSQERYSVAMNALAKHTYSLSFVQDLLAGKYGFMCQYETPDIFDTIWASVYDLKNGKHYRCEGNPSRNMFKEDVRMKKSS